MSSPGVKVNFTECE
ncbi:hypothetical protein CP8484711_1031A, partial [Chlamydia psittaci 84-8471/1]